jgi:hypothetical protein
MFLNSNKKIDDYNSKSEFVDDFYKMAIIKYPELKDEKIVNQLKSGLITDLDKDSNIDNHFKKSLKAMLDEGKMSNILYQGMIEIVDSHNYKKSMEIISTLEKQNLTENDKTIIETYKSVANSSNELWSSKKKFPDHSDMVIVADGIGAVLFWWSGPGAGVAAAVYSLVVNNCKPHC